MALSGLLAFVLVVSVTKGSDARLTVAAARDDIPAGAALTSDLLREVELPADADLARTTVPWDRSRTGNQVAARPIAAGELLRPSDLLAGPGSGGSRLRAMSIPVKRERAVGGTLRVGDRVDVIDVVEGVAHWVVTGAQVIEVPRQESSRGMVREVGAVYHVVVEVDAVQALVLAEALGHDTLSVVRSTGAPPPSDRKSPTSAGAEAAHPSTVPNEVPPASGAGGPTPAPGS